MTTSTNWSYTSVSKGITCTHLPTSIRYRRKFSTIAKPNFNCSVGRPNRRSPALARTSMPSSRPCATNSTIRAGRCRQFTHKFGNEVLQPVLRSQMICAGKSHNGIFGTPISRSSRRRIKKMRKQHTNARSTRQRLDATPTRSNAA